ncbi:MAG: methionine synthase [Lentisphaerae bacterium]|nr:methionine synthase [Lentisphaerota bacterium]
MLERFESRVKHSLLLCDGAMGTMLQARGLNPGECPEVWCVERPQDVVAIHQEYRDAGSDIVECNSFGGNIYKLRHYGLEAQHDEINCAAAALAAQVAAGERYVLASMGPTGAFMEPYGDETEDDFYNCFKNQAIAFAKGGADAVIVETMTAIEECCVAIRAIRENTSLAVVASFTFDPQPNGSYASMMGVRPEGFAAATLEAGAHVIGANCGLGPDHMLNIITALRQATPDTPLMAMPNAGMPVIENGVTVFKEEPEAMALKMRAIVEAGATIIGGCCGTTPAHIAAFRAILK